MSACFEFFLIEQVESLLRNSIGIEIVECAVCPPGSRSDAIPDDAKHRTMELFPLRE
jgi:hypothetical protein